MRLDPREVLGLDRHRRRSRCRARRRPDPGQRDVLLADPQRRVVGAHLLGELPDALHQPRRGTHRGRDLPQGDLPTLPTLGRAPLHQHHSVGGTRPRRPFRGLRTTRAVRRAASNVFSSGPPVGRQCRALAERGAAAAHPARSQPERVRRIVPRAARGLAGGAVGRDLTDQRRTRIVGQICWFASLGPDL